MKTIDDEDDASKKRIKSEETVIKVEENTGDNDPETPASGSVGEYFWSSGWTPAMGTEKLQQHYEPYEARDIGGTTGEGYGNVDVGCTNVDFGRNVNRSSL